MVCVKSGSGAKLRGRACAGEWMSLRLGETLRAAPGPGVARPVMLRPIMMMRRTQQEGNEEGAGGRKKVLAVTVIVGHGNSLHYPSLRRRSDCDPLRLARAA